MRACTIPGGRLHLRRAIYLSVLKATCSRNAHAIFCTHHMSSPSRTGRCCGLCTMGHGWGRSLPYYYSAISSSPVPTHGWTYIYITHGGHYLLPLCLYLSHPHLFSTIPSFSHFHSSVPGRPASAPISAAVHLFTRHGLCFADMPAMGHEPLCLCCVLTAPADMPTHCPCTTSFLL